MGVVSISKFQISGPCLTAWRGGRRALAVAETNYDLAYEDVCIFHASFLIKNILDCTWNRLLRGIKKFRNSPCVLETMSGSGFFYCRHGFLRIVTNSIYKEVSWHFHRRFSFFLFFSVNWQ